MINQYRNAQQTGWIEGVMDGRYWQAEVYREGSSFGIDGGRVSKLTICSTPRWDHQHVIFRYDRGEDVNEVPASFVGKIVALFPEPKAATR